jgi:hypothetical protein
MKRIYQVEDQELEQAGASGAKAIARYLADQISDIRMRTHHPRRHLAPV